MRFESIQIKGFRCFSPAGQTIPLDSFTCFVGPNASGKTAIMSAMSRVFGENQGERTVRSSDFFLQPGEKLDAVEERKLSVEIRLAFPELDATAPGGPAVPETFNQMVVAAPGATPYCRVRLEATWTRDNTPLGDVQQRLWWITTPSDEPEVIAANQSAVKAAERSRIRVTYVPAARDPAAQIRGTTTTAFGRLLESLAWAGHDDNIKKQLLDLKKEIEKLQGIGTINEKVQAAWKALYDGRVAANVAFEAVDADPAALLKLLAPSFAPDEQGNTTRAAELSDGLRSLFALSLPLGLHRIEEAMKADAAAAGFDGAAAEKLPLLTMFAIEEPENHLSPHYLGKIVTELKAISATPCAQVVLSSHSPSVMSRVEPDNVRYLRGGEQQAATEVRTLALPKDDQDEAFKYVREAVRGYPELYFSRLVILGEGPSEEIVLRKLFEASGTPLDGHFISVVPLGGRHVNHFWRLLDGLGIPYLTLLDLDREKEGAGWGRIQYVRDQLVGVLGTDSERLSVSARGERVSLADARFESLKDRDDRTDASKLATWVKLIQSRFDVFFSSPLDLDFAMLGAFPGVYQGQAPPNGGPRLPEDGPERDAAMRARMRQVLASDPKKAPAELGSSYSEEEVERFTWYKYLFLDGSKPVAHLRALVALDGTPWHDTVPPFLRALLVRARELVGPPPVAPP